MLVANKKKIEAWKKESRSKHNGDATRALLKLSTFYNQTRDKSAFTYATKALERAIRYDEKEMMAEAHLHLAVYFCRTRTDYVTSLNHCKKALHFQSAFKTKRLLAEVFKTIGVNFYYLGEIQNAQENYKNALDILLSNKVKNKEEIKDIADLYYNLAILNRSAETNSLRKEYLEAAQKYYQQIDFKTGVARCLDGIAVYYFYAGDQKKSLEQLLKALKIFEAQKDREGAYLVYNNIGTLKIQAGKFEEGIDYLKRSLRLRSEVGNPVPIAISHINISNALMDQQLFSEALPHLKAAEKILKKAKSKIELSSLMLALTRCYKHLGNFEAALVAQTNHLKLREDLHKYELEKAYHDTSTRFDVELMEKNAMIDRLKNFEIASYIHRLEVSNNELRQFAHAASHDLKEPLRTITSFVNLLEKHCEKKIDDTGREYLHYILAGTKRLDRLVKDLLNLSQINLSETPFTDVDLNVIYKEVVVNLAAIIGEKNAQVRSDKLPVVSADKTQMFQLFLNLIANGIKYNESATPSVHVSYSEDGAFTTLSFTDNGIGIPETYRHKIFEIFQRLHPREKYSGTGIGLTLCQRIVERHRGKIWVESNHGKGSVFHVSLPV